MDDWKAKNYLTSEVLDDLNRIVMMFLDHAEDMAKHNRIMTMSDWDKTVNEFLTFRRREACLMQQNYFYKIFCFRFLPW